MTIPTYGNELYKNLQRNTATILKSSDQSTHQSYKKNLKTLKIKNGFIYRLLASGLNSKLLTLIWVSQNWNNNKISDLLEEIKIRTGNSKPSHEWLKKQCFKMKSFVFFVRIKVLRIHGYSTMGLFDLQTELNQTL